MVAEEVGAARVEVGAAAAARASDRRERGGRRRWRPL